MPIAAKMGASISRHASCMSVKYCNASCQRNHWPTHKKQCKHRATELRDEALFKDPPAKEDCPICFLPIPDRLLSCMLLPPATILSVPIYDFAMANKGLECTNMEIYYPCCGKTICGGCIDSFIKSGNTTCPFCKADAMINAVDEEGERIMKRVEANDAGEINVLANYYHNGNGGYGQDKERAMELWKEAAEPGYAKAHFKLGNDYYHGGV